MTSTKSKMGTLRFGGTHCEKRKRDKQHKVADKQKPEGDKITSDMFLSSQQSRATQKSSQTPDNGDRKA